MARRKQPTVAESIGGLLFLGILLLIKFIIEHWQVVCIVIGSIIVLVIVINVSRKQLQNRRNNEDYMIGLSSFNSQDNDYENNYTDFVTTSYRDTTQEIKETKQQKRKPRKKSTTKKKTTTQKKETKKKSNKEKISITSCSFQDLIDINITPDSAEQIINKRDDGRIWYNFESLLLDVNLQAHEQFELQNKLIFPPKPKINQGRKVDW